MKSLRKRVLLALGWYDYRLHLGIERYAQEHGWTLSSNYARERVIPWGWDGDGILAWLGAGDDLAKFVWSTKKPTVDMSLRRPKANCARVVEHNAHAGRLAARHLLDRRVESFAFYSDKDHWTYNERGEGFMEEIAAAGKKCVWLRRHQAKDVLEGRGEWQRRLRWLAKSIASLPGPLGVLAANDQQALEVLEACEMAKRKVPEEVAIVGVGNYLLAPNSMPTPISSVDMNLELLGYKAAATLDGLMRGNRVPAQPVRVPAKEVVARKSSDLLAINHSNIARAIRFIWDNAHEPISVADVVRVAAMSRRSLHDAFLQQVGRTPGDEIRRVRIDAAKRVLAETDEKVESAALRSGYQSLNSFCVAFKTATGKSPGQFRREARGTA